MKAPDDLCICPFSLNDSMPLYCNEGIVGTADQSFVASSCCRAWKKFKPVDDTDTVTGGYCKLIEGRT